MERIPGLLSMRSFAKLLGVSTPVAKNIADENPDYCVVTNGKRWVSAGLFYKVSGFSPPTPTPEGGDAA